MLAPAWLLGPDWLATDKLLAYFAPDQSAPAALQDRTSAQQRYVDHVRAGVGLPSVWEALSGQIYLGDEKFVSKMTALAGLNPQDSPGKRTGRSTLEIPQAQRRPKPQPLAAYQQQHPTNRNAAIQAAFATGGFTMAQLAAHFELHYTSVSRIVKMEGM
jgi:putative transposase